MVVTCFYTRPFYFFDSFVVSSSSYWLCLSDLPMHAGVVEPSHILRAFPPKGLFIFVCKMTAGGKYLPGLDLNTVFVFKRVLCSF